MEALLQKDLILYSTISLLITMKLGIQSIPLNLFGFVIKECLPVGET